MDHGLWSGVAGGGEVVAVSLHANGLQPILHCAHGRRRLGAPWLQQGGVRPGGGWKGGRGKLVSRAQVLLVSTDVVFTVSAVLHLQSVFDAAVLQSNT